jgi:hypothetical protein
MQTRCRDTNTWQYGRIHTHFFRECKETFYGFLQEREQRDSGSCYLYSVLRSANRQGWASRRFIYGVMLGALDIVKFENPWLRAYVVMFMKWYERKLSVCVCFKKLPKHLSGDTTWRIKTLNIAGLRLGFESATFQSKSVNCCWSSPAQSFLVSGPVGIHCHILLLSRLSRVCNGASSSTWGVFWLLLVTPLYWGVTINI